MTPELLVVVVPVAAVAGLVWWRQRTTGRKQERPTVEPIDSFLHWETDIKPAPLPEPGPPAVTRSLQFAANAAIGPEPIDGVGWLAPDGVFHGNGPGNHYDCAYRLLESEDWRERKPVDPLRNYERELEESGYIKLLRNAYFYGWTRPAKWRMSRPQQEELVNWYTMHARPMPDWLKEMIAV